MWYNETALQSPGAAAAAATTAPQVFAQTPQAGAFLTRYQTA